VANRCNGCHSVRSVGISKAGSEEGPDLSRTGSKHNKQWMASWLLQKVEIDGVKHKKRFGGSTADLKALATWLAERK
jgi:hypothetical protein